MNITICENCGVVLDLDVIFDFPSYDSVREDMKKTHFEWNGEDYIRKCNCPVCEEKLLDEN